jgi:hypothetical protein
VSSFEEPSKMGLPMGLTAVLAGVVVLCVVGFSAHGGASVLLEYPMNADAIGDSGLESAKAQMAFGGMEALQRQVDEMDINWGNKPTHVKQHFADAYGKLNALKKLVAHMETKDFDESSTSSHATTPDEVLQSVMAQNSEAQENQPNQRTDEQEQLSDQDGSEDDDVLNSMEAAFHQRGRAGLHRLHSLHLAQQRPSSAAEGVVTPPFMGHRRAKRQVVYDPALNLDSAERRRLAARAASRFPPDAIGTEAVVSPPETDAVVAPPWTR